MNEDLARKAQAQAREFPETMEILARIRTALAERVFITSVNDTQERENLYLRVQAIDAMMGEMQLLLATSASTDVIEEYAKHFATTGE